MAGAKLDMSKLIDLNVDLFMYLIEEIRFATWKKSTYELGLKIPSIYYILHPCLSFTRYIFLAESLFQFIGKESQLHLLRSVN